MSLIEYKIAENTHVYRGSMVLSVEDSVGISALQLSPVVRFILYETLARAG